MSSRMQRNLGVLELLYKSPPRVRKVIISNANVDLINALCEIALNVLKGAIPLNDKQYRQLKKKKAVIRRLADKKVKTPQKRKAINQSGGFLLPLLGAAIPLITSLISSRNG